MNSTRFLLTEPSILMTEKSLNPFLRESVKAESNRGLLPLTLQEISRAVEGLVILGDPRQLIGGEYKLSTDSRDLKRGDIFVAIKGVRFDGHAFIETCMKKGASLCVVSKLPENLVLSPTRMTSIVKVKDTKIALGNLAGFYREKYGASARRVAIAGSSGKTSVKEMTAQILSGYASTVYSQGNFNNEIGCPLSVFSIRPSDTFGVFEIGASARGEVERLSAIVAPNVAVVTNISLEHTETFGTLEAIAQGETEVLTQLEHFGTAVLPRNDTFYDYMISRLPKDRGVQSISFGLTPEADVHAKDIALWPLPARFTLVSKGSAGLPAFELPCKISAPGKFNILNACAAAAASLAAGAPPKSIPPALENFKPASMRFEIVQLKNERIVVNDAYNSNPGSVRASLEGFTESFPNKRLCVVLGDMLELGEISGREHRELGKFLARLPLTRIILFGTQSRFTFEGAKEALLDSKSLRHVQDRETLLDEAESALEPGTAILFKGSRGMKLDEIAKKVMEHFR